MDFINFLGFVAGLLTTIAFIPQMWKIWKRKSARDVSYVMLIIFLTGIFLWFVYGIYLKALPIILANGFTLLFNFVILGLKMKYK
jgi:MtN3 and saliva related transmembrane protein